jgi:DNA helicase HerA-like ATPase
MDNYDPTHEENNDAFDDADDDQRASTNGAGGNACIGRVGAPPQKEATSTNFYFWIPPDGLVEKTQLITCKSNIATRNYTFYAIIDEVYRQSRKRSMGGEIDEADGDVNHRPPFQNEGFTYALASILRSEVFTPPQERSPIYLASAEEARVAYGSEDIQEGRALEIGLIKNGANQIAGPGMIDLDYLLGVNGGHMNVSGSAGRGTKSSFLMLVNWLLLYRARQEADKRQSAGDRLRIVPIILNVKGFDLFYIDCLSKRYRAEEHLADWRELDIDNPGPFKSVTFFAPESPIDGEIAVSTGRGAVVRPYSWSLADIISNGLFAYLFAEVDANDANFSALVLDVESWLTRENNEGGEVVRSLRAGEGVPTTFRALLDWVDRKSGEEKEEKKWRNHHPSTWKKLYRRLLRLVYECRGVLRIDEQRGNPLVVTRTDTSDPLVIDLSTLAGKPEIQRFVVATIFRQLVDARTGPKAQAGLVYLVTLDELNRFAPRGASDAITRLIETVAAEMRSQGIILLGAQQQASRVSEKVIENAALRVLGKTGTLELDTTAWRILSASAKSKASVLPLNEKLIIQDNFREPMHVRVPFPVWAMNPREAIVSPASGNNTSKSSDDEILTY